MKTPKGQAARKRYRESEKGKETLRLMLERRKRDRAEATAARLAAMPPKPPPVPRPPDFCQRCNILIEGRPAGTKYCFECSDEVQREHRRRYSRSEKGKAAHRRAHQAFKVREMEQAAAQ